MYSSPDDARSDLFLAGAVFLFGRTIIAIVRGIVPVDAIPGVSALLEVVVPLATTVLVPFLLIRYRREPWSMYGLGGSRAATSHGMVLGVPIAVATTLGLLAAGGSLWFAVPLLGFTAGEWLYPLARLAQWVGVALLAVYATVKARDAFRGTYLTLRDGYQEVTRILVIVAAAAAGLVVLANLAAGVGVLLAVVPPALGVAGTVVLAGRDLRGPSSVTRPVLVTPTVLLGLESFRLILGDATTLVLGLYQAALFAAVGLVIGLLQETRRSAWAAIGLALVIALASNLGLLAPTR